MDIAVVDSHVAALVLDVYHTREIGVCRCHLHTAQREPVSAGNGERTKFLEHLVVRILRLVIQVVIYLHVVPVAAFALQRHGIVLRSSRNLRHRHVLVVYTTLDVDGHRSVDTVLQRVHGSLYRAVVSARAHCYCAAHALYHLGGSRCRLFNVCCRLVCRDALQLGTCRCLRSSLSADVAGEPEVVSARQRDLVRTIDGKLTALLLAEEVYRCKLGACSCSIDFCIGEGIVCQVDGSEVEFLYVQNVEVAVSNHLNLLQQRLGTLHRSFRSHGGSRYRSHADRLFLVCRHLDCETSL